MVLREPQTLEDFLECAKDSGHPVTITLRPDPPGAEFKTRTTVGRSRALQVDYRTPHSGNNAKRLKATVLAQAHIVRYVYKVVVFVTLDGEVLDPGQQEQYANRLNRQGFWPFAL